MYLFLERGGGREKERDRNINVWLPLVVCTPSGELATTQACVLTGNRTSNPLLHSPALNPLSHTARAKFNYYWACLRVLLMDWRYLYE